jgi:hypothetical protein
VVRLTLPAARGLAGGVLGGFLFLLWSGVYAIFARMSFWAPFAPRRLTLLGLPVVAHNLTGSIALGVLAHLATGAVLGALYGAAAGVLLGPREAGTYAFYGLAFGLAIWALGPAAGRTYDPFMAARLAPWAHAVGLALYGAFTGSYVGGGLDEPADRARGRW